MRVRSGSIRSRILLAALVPLVLAVISVGALLLTRHAMEIERNLVERTVSLARQAAMLAELPLATGSRTNVQAVADFVERSVGIVGLSLTDRDGATVDNRGNVGATALRMLDGKPLSVQVERDPHLVSVVHPVVLFALPSPGSAPASTGASPGQRVGYVALSVSREDERRSVARLWWTGAAILLVAVLLSLALTRAATRAVAEPLAALSTAMGRVARDDFSAQLPETGRGEFRRLAVDFNSMTRALHAARRGLRDDVAQATAALDARTREAEAANNAKSRFLAAASHDLRQPAHALSLYVAALRQGLRMKGPDVSDALIPAVDGIQAASRSLDALLNAVLDISRFDAGVVSAEAAEVGARALIDEALTVLRSGASERGLRLRSRVPDVTLHTDATLLRRIIDNLVSNAIRFSRSGGILVALRPRRDHVLLQVWDQGSGIAAANLPLIFDEFYQVKRSDVAQGGMGLGLAIVARSVRLLGGDIKVSSRLGSGTCFTVTLPGTALPRRNHVTSVVRPVTHDRQLVLVLDDDALIRSSMQTLFSALGVSVHAEASIAPLLDVARQEKASVAAIVVDYRLLDGFTGIEAANRLREVVGAVVPIVLITGDTSAERLRALTASGFPVLHKPLDSDRLLAALGMSGGGE